MTSVMEEYFLQRQHKIPTMCALLLLLILLSGMALSFSFKLWCLNFSYPLKLCPKNVSAVSSPASF